MPTIETVFTENIRLDGGTQPRAMINQQVCDEYLERMRAGDSFPPIDVFFDGKSYWLVDGCHRLWAHRLTRPGEAIICRVFKGSLQEAQWHSYGVNKTHGLRRTNADKERAVRAAVAHPMAADKSNRQIAEHCGVSEGMVRKYRAFRDGISSVTVSKIRTVTRAGKTYRLDTTRIGRAKRVGCTATPSRCMTGYIMRSTRTPSIAQKMITLGMPRDPFQGAMLLIDLLDAKYLRTLVDVISNQLKNA
jgi:hypothetical protein